MKDNFEVVCLSEGIFNVWNKKDKKFVPADFNSKGAAKAAIEVEIKRMEKKSK